MPPRRASPSPSQRAPGGTRKPARKRVLELLDPDETTIVFTELLRVHPEIRKEAELMARVHLADVADSETVADQIEAELLSISSQELSTRSGKMELGYVEPTNAAWEILEEAMEVHHRGVERLVALGMILPAIATAVGVISGLYRCDGTKEGELLLSWAPDFPLDHAEMVVKALGEAGIDWRETLRDGHTGAEFSWDGYDECSPASGRGWAMIDDDGSLRGGVFFHLGDDSAFRAVRADGLRAKAKRARGVSPGRR